MKPSSRRETDDNYLRMTARLNARWRVIECRDQIQWILQRAKKSGHGTAWRARSYCRTAKALQRACAYHAGDIDASAQAILDGLPARIELTAGGERKT